MIGNKSTAKIPKSMMSCFIILAIFFGIDFGFTKGLSPKYRIVVKVWSFLVAAFAVVVLIFPLIFTAIETDYTWMSLVGCQCFLNYLFLFFSKITMYDFILKIYRVDRNVAMSLQKELVGYATCFYIIVALLMKFLSAYLYFYLSNSGIQADIEGGISLKRVMIAASYSPDAFSVVFPLVYFHIYYYTKKLHELVMTSKINVKDVQNYYIKLSFCCDEIRGLNDRLLVVALTFETCELMLSIYRFLQYAKGGINSANIFALLSNSYIFLRVWIPAMMGQRIIVTTEAIKLALHSQLLSCKDSWCHKNDDILDTIQYMDRRGLIRKIWSFIPIDVNLPLDILKFIITYLLIIIQFTHLYDCDSAQ